MNYSVGDIISYKTFMDNVRMVVVTEKHADIKNGQRGFDGHMVGDPTDTVWGYDRQITAVYRRAA